MEPSRSEKWGKTRTKFQRAESESETKFFFSISARTSSAPAGVSRLLCSNPFSIIIRWMLPVSDSLTTNIGASGSEVNLCVLDEDVKAVRK